jgi:gliding motility-associated-like protein
MCSIHVVLKPTPHLEIDPNPTTIFSGESLYLHVSSQLYGTQYLWETGSTFISILLTPPYSTMVEVMGVFESCTSKGIAYIYVIDPVESEFIKYMPNTFSPNDDGLNDLFVPVLTDATIVSIYIYNRWNNLVYYSENPNIEWDGTFNGEPCPPGVYGYKMFYKKSTSESLKQYIGHVNIIRD